MSSSEQSRHCARCGKVLRTPLAQRLFQLDTTSDVISACSPNGKVSGRARRAVNAQIDERLFGVASGCTGDCVPSPASIREQRIAALRSRIQTLETCCAGQLRTGRQNKMVRALVAVKTELESLLGEQS